MSNLHQKNGDDYPDAAGKHLADAKVLLGAARLDGAAYHSGYVVECALKTLLQLEGAPGWGHHLSNLAGSVAKTCTISGASTARYITQAVRGVAASSISAWQETLRYQSPVMAPKDTATWVNEAQKIYSDTIVKMVLDGVIQ